MPRTYEGPGHRTIAIRCVFTQDFCLVRAKLSDSLRRAAVIDLRLLCYRFGMTRKLSISLPDDLAARLDEAENASAVIATALRKHFMGASVRETLNRHGFNITDEGLAQAQREYDKALESITDETRIEAARMYAE